MVKKHQIALFLNKGTISVPDWTRIKKSTSLTISMNPETEDFDYISDEVDLEEIADYIVDNDEDFDNSDIREILGEDDEEDEEEGGED